MTRSSWRTWTTWWCECAQMFYWMYFRPFTLVEYPQHVHPDLVPTRSPFHLCDDFTGNPVLARYARQVSHLAQIVPILAVVFVGGLLTLVNNPFEWVLAFELVLPFALGVRLVCDLDRGWLARWSLGLSLLIVGIICVFLTLQLLVPSLSDSFPKLMTPLTIQLPFELTERLLVLCRVVSSGLFTVAIGMIVGAATGVAADLAADLAAGVAIGVTTNVAIFVTTGAAAGVAGGVEFGVVVGMVVGMVAGAAAGVGFGVARSVGFGVVVGMAGAARGVQNGVLGGDAVLYVVFGVATVAGSLRLFFWLIEASWMFVLWLMARGGRAGYMLRRLPIYYDEFIVLPLPFLDHFLAEAYRYNQAGARQTIDYLTTHSRQQVAARRALVLIALHQLTHCKNTDEIVAAREELRWLSEPPPPELGPTLPGLLDVSQGVRASQEATTRHRQAGVLKRQVERLRELREGLVIMNPNVASQYGQIIDRWTRIVTTAVQVLQAQAGAEAEIPPVYVAGAHLRPEYAGQLFKGRQDIFREIETAQLASRPPVLLLTGQRRTGKTSLIAYLPARLPAEVMPVRVNVQNAAAAATHAGLAYNIAQEITDSARRGRNLILPAPRLADFQLDAFVTLGGWLRSVEKTAPSRRFLLCLDEYQRLEEVITATGSRAILNFLRDLMEHRERWSLMLVGSASNEELASYWSDYLINARRLRISYLAPNEARDLIEHPVPSFEEQMRYEEAAREAIVRLTRGQPFLVQLICGELVDLLNREKRRVVIEADVEAVIALALEHGGEYFDELWQQATPKERDVLCRVAADTFQTGDERILAALCRRELLEPTDGSFQFQVPLVARWVRNRTQWPDALDVTCQ